MSLDAIKPVWQTHGLSNQYIGVPTLSINSPSELNFELIYYKIMMNIYVPGGQVVLASFLPGGRGYCIIKTMTDVWHEMKYLGIITEVCTVYQEKINSATSIFRYSWETYITTMHQRSSLFPLHQMWCWNHRDPSFCQFK